MAFFDSQEFYTEAKRAFTPRWITQIQLTWKADLFAGVSVAVVAVPQAMAYAQLAGLPAHYGLYATFLPTIIAGITSSSRHVTTGPVAIIALLTVASVSKLAPEQTHEYIVLVALLALMVGLFQVLFGLLKLGSLIRYVAHPVVTGFVHAAAIVIAFSQLEALLGISGEGPENFILGNLELIKHLPNIDPATLVYGTFSIAVIVLARKYYPRLPAILFVVVATTIVSWATGYNGAIVGPIPLGLPEFGFDFGNLGMVSSLLTPAVLIAMIAYMEGYSIAKSIGTKAKYRIQPNREMISQGLANIVSSFSGTMPVSGSFARSALNYSVGAKSNYASVFVGLSTLVVIVFLAPIFRYLPQATLAAIIMTAVTRLINIDEFVHLFRTHIRSGFVAVVTFVVTLIFAPDMDIGLLVGIAISVLGYLHYSANPYFRIAWLGDPDQIHNLRFKFRTFETNRKVLAVALEWSILFINASSFEDKVLDAVQKQKETKYVLILGRGINHIDATGEEALMFIYQNLKAKNVQLYFAGFNSSVIETMRRSRSLKLLGEEHFFTYGNEALAAISEREGE